MFVQTNKKHKNDGAFFYLCILTSFFFLLEISFFIQCNQAYFSDFQFVTNNIHIPSSILPEIFFFIFAQISLHVLYCVLIWAINLSLANLFHWSKDKTIKSGIIIWLISLLTIFVANIYYFPNSKFAKLFSFDLFNHHNIKPIFILLTLFFVVICLLAVSNIVYVFYKRGKALSLALMLFVFIFTGTWLSLSTNLATDASSRDRPNVVLIGVDSLRPDFLSFFGYEKSTPFFDNFLSQATVFSDAITPLARTFPSWTGILTGQYPRENGVRFNLAPQNNLELSNTLPAILKQYNYVTVYATDETRFSNIDTNFGFDRVITPPMGLNDFLLGNFNDFPISNLLVNTVIGKFLFPYSYANRPVFFTYSPNTFLNELQTALNRPRTKPMFLAVHFCLPHHPYAWASLANNQYSIFQRYEQSIKRVDRQVKDFFSILQRDHVLDHAIVILLSDHGEALAFPGDRVTEKDLFKLSNQSKTAPDFYPHGEDDEAMNLSVGHGTDVLGLPQYHSLLSFQLYGLDKVPSRVISQMVSLLDIKPTILALLKIKKVAKDNGQSLAELILGTKKALSPRHLFLESDYSPSSIHTVFPETRKVMLEGVDLFEINPHTSRLIVKEAMGKMMISSKQYADIYGDWMLALYPQNHFIHMPILINLKTGEWTNDLHSSFAQKAPAMSMLKKLKVFYGKEIYGI